MQEYVVGFAFWRDSVLLIHKKKGPSYVVGKLNGVGGKVEYSDDSFYHSMSREFLEEVDFSIYADEWEHIAIMNGPDYILHILSINLPDDGEYDDFSNPEDTGENLHWVPLTSESFDIGYYDSESDQTIQLVENLSWIIPLIKDKTTPFLEIYE